MKSIILDVKNRLIGTPRPHYLVDMAGIELDGN